MGKLSGLTESLSIQAVAEWLAFTVATLDTYNPVSSEGQGTQ